MKFRRNALRLYGMNKLIFSKTKTFKTFTFSIVEKRDALLMILYFFKVDDLHQIVTESPE